jgi:uncharacterized protein YjaG (DUF416 family)
MTDFNGSILRQKLASLSKTKQLAFLLLLDERMILALDKFSRETNFNASIYQECLDNAWRSLAGDTTISSYGKMAEECLDHAPDTEEFDHPLTSAALNAALSTGAMMSFLADYDVDRVVEAAGLACDTAALNAQSIEAIPPHSLGFTEIVEHPLVRQEVQRQMEDLEFLESLPIHVSQTMVKLIKERGQN